MDCRHGSAFSLDLFDMNLCKIYHPFMQDYPIQHTLIQTWMISDIDFRVHSSAVTHRRDTNLGIWTWVGLTSDNDATSPQSNALVLH